MGSNNNFTEGKIFSPLIKFAIPVLFAQLLQAMYGAADLMIVGKFADAASVSAVSTGAQMISTITNLIVGLSMGVTIHLGQKIGEKSDKTGDVIGSAIIFFGCFTIVITALVFGFTVPYASLMNVPKEAFSLNISYVRICSAGLLFIVAYNLIGSIFRGMGDSKTPLFTVLVAAIINVFLDLLLVGVFKLSANGAAIATVISQGFSVLFCLMMIKRNGLPFKFDRSNLHYDHKINNQSLKFGIPVATQSLLINFSFMFIVSLVNSLGVIASAGVGVAEKLCNFIMLIPSSLSSALGAFVAQNVGAKKYDRASKSLLACIGISFVTSIVIFYFSFFHGDILCSLFAKDNEVVLAGFEYLKSYAIDVMFTSFLFCLTGYFNGFGKTVFVMIQGTLSSFLIRIPVAYFMAHLTPVSLFKVGLSIPITTFIQIFVCLIYFTRLQSAYPMSKEDIQ